MFEIAADQIGKLNDSDARTCVGYEAEQEAIRNDGDASSITLHLAARRELRAKTGGPAGRFEDIYRTAVGFLSTPCKIWFSDEWSTRVCCRKPAIEPPKSL